MSKNPPDWWARSIGGLGLLIAVGGLVLGYFNYRWQKNVYEKSQEERVFAQLSAAYVLIPLETKETPIQDQLAVEVVNLRLQPIYLRSVTGEIGRQRASFYERDPMKADPMRRLELGEGADYKINWPMASFKDISKQAVEGIIEVETTKKLFAQSAQLNRANAGDGPNRLHFSYAPERQLRAIAQPSQ